MFIFLFAYVLIDKTENKDMTTWTYFSVSICDDIKK